MVENQEKNITNEVVIVTGGSRGIGASIVKYLARKGFTVILDYNKSETCAKNVENELKKEGLTVDIFKADVSKKAEAEALIQYALGKYGKVDVLINNAGVSQTKLFTEITDEDWDNMLNNNLNSAFYCTREVVKCMISNKQGLIINISSIWGLTGGSMEVHYSTAKAGLIGFTKALAKELGPSNIRVNAIAPGIIDTDMNKEYTTKEIENLEKEIPLERIGKTESIAKCVSWLIEDDYTTGEIISINGGWHM